MRGGKVMKTGQTALRPIRGVFSPHRTLWRRPPVRGNGLVHKYVSSSSLLPYIPSILELALHTRAPATSRAIAEQCTGVRVTTGDGHGIRYPVHKQGGRAE